MTARSMATYGVAVAALLLVTTAAAGQPRPRKPAKTPESVTRPDTSRQPKVSEQQQANVSELAADLQRLRGQSAVTEAQKQALAEDLLALADGATKPDEELVEQLANDLADALADGEISQREAVKLVSDIEQVMNSANIPKTEVDAVIADAQAILIASGVTKSDAQEIAADLKAIAAELRQNITTATTTAPRLPVGPPKAPMTRFTSPARCRRGSRSRRR